METILELRNLVKLYPGVKAVDGISLSITQGICFGLLGPNGAGKTTTLEIIEGITEPTSGEILYRGDRSPKRFHERIGIQFQSTALPDRLKVIEVLRMFRSFYRHALDLDELVAWCDLNELLERDAGKLSGGQRQRLLLALALVNDPDLVFLDEPTTGLDPSARRAFWDLIETVKKRKKTVILTTHYMEEAYELCDEIAIMEHGRIIAQGSPDRLLQEHFRGLAIRIPFTDLRAEPERIPGRVYRDGEVVEIQTEHVNETLKFLLDSGTQLSGVQVRSRDLEDLFLALTGKRSGE